MTDAFVSSRGLVSIVLADANVLYSRVLCDYLLYAAAEQLISVRGANASSMSSPST
ncbi:MAG: hypothetical protein ACRDOT_03555 [Aeromicrobium sp.]